MLFYIKSKGGDPRNHNWLEVGQHDYNNTNKEYYFKKEVKHAKQKSKNKKKRKEKT